MRGQKLSQQEIYDIMTSWSITQNTDETAKELGIPRSTVGSIVNRYKDQEEFVKLRQEKKEEFAKIADRIMRKAAKRIERELDDDTSYIPVNHLVTVMGTAYDKKALAEGRPTERTEIVGGDMLSKLAELAGYERKQ